MPVLCPEAIWQHGEPGRECSDAVCLHDRKAMKLHRQVPFFSLQHLHGSLLVTHPIDGLLPAARHWCQEMPLYNLAQREYDEAWNHLSANYDKTFPQQYPTLPGQYPVFLPFLRQCSAFLRQYLALLSQQSSLLAWHSPSALNEQPACHPWELQLLEWPILRLPTVLQQPQSPANISFLSVSFKIICLRVQRYEYFS